MGMEYSSCRIHMNLINIEVAPPIYANPTNEELQQVIDFVHAQGGALYDFKYKLLGFRSVTDSLR